MSIDEVRRIIGPLNREITADYTRLTNEMRERLGVGDRPVVDWCGFASWISFSLGAFLRSREDNEALDMHPWWRRIFIDWALPMLLKQEQWEGLAAGNRAIYTEMRAFYEVVAAFDGFTPQDAFEQAGAAVDAVWDTEHFNFVEDTEEDKYWGRHAVRSLILAAATDDVHQKSELIFSASVALSAIEQRRTDVQIDAFFDGIISNRRWIPKRFRKRAMALSARFTTRWMTHFTFARRFVSVGRPLTQPDAGRYAEPGRTLDEITSPWAHVALDRFWVVADPQATDWRSYEQRMRFIVALFCNYQEVSDLLDYENFPEPTRTHALAGSGSLFSSPDPDFVASAKPEPYPLDWYPRSDSKR